MPDIIHFHTTFAVCPYCGESDHNCDELFATVMEGEDDTECGSCGRMFFVEKHCSITYSTRRKEDA